MFTRILGLEMLQRDHTQKDTTEEEGGSLSKEAMGDLMGNFSRDM